MRLHLLCHGQTDAVLAAAFPDDEPLNPHGIASATALAGNLPRVDAARCAASARCVQTAAALDVVATVDSGLSECEYGRWRGHSLARVHADEPEALARWLGEPDAAPHGGESILGLCARVGGWLDGLDGEIRSLLGIADASVIKAAVLHAMRAGAESFWRVDIAPLSLTILSGQQERWTVRSAGCTGAQPT